jgi:hypothetical protein
MTRDDKVVDFPNTEERARRLQAEVERLAQLPLVEWMFYVESSGIAERHGIERAKLKQMVEAVLRAKEKKKRDEKAEQQRIEQRADLFNIPRPVRWQTEPSELSSHS